MGDWCRSECRCRYRPNAGRSGRRGGSQRFHEDRAHRIADEIVKSGGQAIAVPFDVTDLVAVIAGFDEASARIGPVDVVVNNAGTGGPTEPMHVSPFADMSPDKCGLTPVG